MALTMRRPTFGIPCARLIPLCATTTTWTAPGRVAPAVPITTRLSWVGTFNCTYGGWANPPEGVVNGTAVSTKFTLPTEVVAVTTYDRYDSPGLIKFPMKLEVERPFESV